MKDRIELFGCYMDNLTMEETLDVIEGFVQEGGYRQHVVVNVDKIVKASRDPQLRSIINQCDLINVDGMPIVWASRLLGRPIKERVAGIDLFEALVARAAVKGWRIFLLGATENVVSQISDRFTRLYGKDLIAGYRNGYWTPDEDELVARQIAQAEPDLLFVAISSPKKEQFLGRYQAIMRVPFAMGVGGSFDVLAGHVRRAPLWMQRSGLEWFFRFLQEPTRMFRRYFVDDLSFIAIFIKALIKRS